MFRKPYIIEFGKNILITKLDLRNAKIGKIGFLTKYSLINVGKKYQL